MKKLFYLLLVTSMLLVSIPSSFALDAANDLGNVSISPSSADIEGINATLTEIESIKKGTPFEWLNYLELKVGNSINLYEYVGNSFVYTGCTYPLLDGEKIVAFAIKLSSGKFQITTQLVEEILSTNISTESIALVYDRNGSYLYDGESLHFLSAYADIRYGEERDILPLNKIKDITPKLNLCKLTNSVPLNYTYNVLSLEEASSIVLNVSMVTQSRSDTCWAASIACIANYLNGTDLTDIQVAKKFYGEEDWNKPLPHASLAAVLYQNNVTRYAGPYTATKNRITKSLSNDRPPIGIFNVYESSKANDVDHDCVIYGISETTLSIAVMDPANGLCLAIRDESSSAGYEYTNLNGNITYKISKLVYYY